MQKRMDVDLEDLNTDAALASEIADLELKLSKIKQTLVSRLSKFIRKEELDPQNPAKEVKALWSELVDDNVQPYEGYEHLANALIDETFAQLLIKKITDDRWYNSDECQTDLKAFDD
jgi:hypothetical protein